VGPLRLAILLALAGAAPALATSATCAIEPGGLTLASHGAVDAATVVSAGDGLALAFEIDDGAGTVVLARDGLPSLPFEVNGVPGVLELAQGAVTGTIDAGGHTALPAFAWSLTVPGGDLPHEYPLASTLFTGVQAHVLRGVEVVSEGASLDFATRVLTLRGGDVVETAPGVVGPTLYELGLTCRLDRVPQRALLPPSPRLETVRGMVTRTRHGDVLGLRARLVPGRQPLDFAGDDLFVRLAAADGVARTLVLVRGGSLRDVRDRGRRYTVRDDDGTTIEILVGGRPAGRPTPRLGGAIAIRTTPFGADVRLRVRGLDLGVPAGSVAVTISVGTQVGRATVPVHGRRLG
jgi:hypothetical protein